MDNLPNGVIKMWLRVKSAVLTVFGILLGLLIMYMALVNKISHLDNVRITNRNISHLKNLQNFIQEYQHDDIHLKENRVNLSTKSEDHGALWRKTQEARRTQIDSTCDNLQVSLGDIPSTMWSAVQNNDNIIIDDKHQVIFCAIPKVACSSWKTAMAMLAGEQLNLNSEIHVFKIHSPYFMKKIGLPSPKYVKESDFQHSVKKYTKILVVRNPMERLLSAYRDKFRTYNKWTRHFQMKYGRKIVLVYRGNNVTIDSLKYGHDVLFKEFLQFSMDDRIPIVERMNPHWDTYQNLCHPCHIKYDHVIKFETMTEDNDIILQKYFGVQNTTGFFPRRNIKAIPSNILMKQYYSKVPLDIINNVYKYYQTDFDMFGYDSLPEILRSS